MGKLIVGALILALVFGGGWFAGVGAWVSNVAGDVVDGISDSSEPPADAVRGSAESPADAVSGSTQSVDRRPQTAGAWREWLVAKQEWPPDGPTPDGPIGSWSWTIPLKDLTAGCQIDECKVWVNAVRQKADCNWWGLNLPAFPSYISVQNAWLTESWPELRHAGMPTPTPTPTHMGPAAELEFIDAVHGLYVDRLDDLCGALASGNHERLQFEGRLYQVR